MFYSKENVIRSCVDRFGKPDIVVFAPGRANIIGEHTDYTEGYVLPFATSQGIYLAAKKIPSQIFSVQSLDTGEQDEVGIHDTVTTSKPGWERYLIRATEQLNLSAIPSGLGIVIGGDLPIGAGMSSSSALTCGFLFLLNEVYNLGYTRFDLLTMAVKAEHGTGVRGGMMDQYTIFYGKKNKAIKLDCQTLQHEEVTIDLNTEGFYLFHSNVKHELLDSPYNMRRDQSEQALEKIRFKKNNPNLLFKDLTLNDLEFSGLDNILTKRAKHVISENERVISMTRALDTKDLNLVGKLLQESHHSLSKDYEVSCDELDFLVENAGQEEGWFGGRMMGGGFGGCTINVVIREKVDSLFYNLNESYKKKFGKDITLIPLVPSDGIRLEVI